MITFLKHLLSVRAGCLALMLTVATACTTGNSQQNDNTVNDGNARQEDGVNVEELASGLNHPWGMAFLPDGQLLVTERAGQLRIMDKNNKLSEPLQGVPEVVARGQGGMLDVAVDPDFRNNRYVYLSFSEPGKNNTASTALGRGKLDNNRLSNFTVIFRQEPKVDGPNHFGGRIVFSADGEIFLTLGERFKFQPAQDNSNHLGTIVRLNRDGSAATGNPFSGNKKGRSEIWSFGHRNIEAAAFDPVTGKFWVAEMGPQGGDELNQPEKGKNHGWPIVSWGRHYNGEDIPDPPTRREFVDAKIHWTPVISPSGMEFYTANLFPNFKGEMLIGGLSSKGLVRVEVSGEKAKEVGRIDLGARIRDVEQGPDGSIYVLTDKRNGNVWKLMPKEGSTISKGSPTEKRN